MLRTYLDRLSKEKNRNRTNGQLTEHSSDFESKTERETFQLINQMRIDSPVFENSNSKHIESNVNFGVSSHTLISSKMGNPKEKVVNSSQPVSVSVEIKDEDFNSDSFEDCEDPSLSSQDFVIGDSEQIKEDEDDYIDLDTPSIQMSKKQEEPQEEEIDQRSEISSNSVDVNFRKRRMPTVHRNIICNGCHRQPLMGTRYMCLYCERFNLCEKCEGNGHEHLMLRINYSNEEYLYQNLREVYFDISMVEKPKRFRKKKSHNHYKVDQLPETIRPPRNKLKGR